MGCSGDGSTPEAMLFFFPRTRVSSLPTFRLNSSVVASIDSFSLCSSRYCSISGSSWASASGACALPGVLEAFSRRNVACEGVRTCSGRVPAWP